LCVQFDKTEFSDFIAQIKDYSASGPSQPRQAIGDFIGFIQKRRGN
jgi:hypothetical protein